MSTLRKHLLVPFAGCTLLMASLVAPPPVQAQSSIGPDEEIGTIAAGTAEDRRVPMLDVFLPINYPLYFVNDAVNRFAMTPIAIGYHYVIPRPVRHGINNFQNNLLTPFSALFNLLQGKIGDSGSEMARFGVNTTVGILGVREAAEPMFDLEPNPEDFGQMLGKWGVHEGPYLVLPFLGPTTLRDFLSLLTMSRDGVEWYRGEQLDPIRYAVGMSITLFNGKSLTYGSYGKSREMAEEADVSHYKFIRDNFVDIRHRKGEDLPPRR